MVKEAQQQRLTRVASSIDYETVKRIQAEQARIEQETGCRPSISMVVAAAIERGLSPAK
jgi:hypothetical protein